MAMFLTMVGPMEGVSWVDHGPAAQYKIMQVKMLTVRPTYTHSHILCWEARTGDILNFKQTRSCP
jgi:hypothetical protein